MKNLFLLVFALLVLVILAPLTFTIRLLFTSQRSDYFYILALGLDRLGAVILYKKLGWTVSSLTFFKYVLTEKPFDKKGFHFYFMHLINLLFGDSKHCENSYFWEINHRQTNTQNTLLKGITSND